MGDGALARRLRWQIAERGDGLLRVPVNHHLLGTAEEIVEVAATLFAAVGDVGSQFRSQIDGRALDDGGAFRIKDGEAQTGSGDGGEADDATVSDGGERPTPVPSLNGGG